MTFVFDACALIAYLRDEAGAEVVEELLVDTGNQCIVHGVNLCELREFDPVAANRICSVRFFR